MDASMATSNKGLPDDDDDQKVDAVPSAEDVGLGWWQLWNFLLNLVKFNRFSHPIKHIQRYLWGIFESEPSKFGHISTTLRFLRMLEIENVVIQVILLIWC